MPYTSAMKVFIICRQRYEEDGKTEYGAVQFRTIDAGWSELKEYAAIFTEAHSNYVSEKLQLKANVNKEKVKFFPKEVDAINA